MKSELKRENEYLKKRLEEQQQEIRRVYEKLYGPKSTVDFDLQAKYTVLQAKYQKLLNDITSKDTEMIVYNGGVYRISTIDYHRRDDQLDTINIEAINVPQEKGLINNLNNTFKGVAKEFNKMLFGNEVQ